VTCLLLVIGLRCDVNIIALYRPFFTEAIKSFISLTILQDQFPLLAKSNEILGERIVT